MTLGRSAPVSCHLIADNCQLTPNPNRQARCVALDSGSDMKFQHRKIVLIVLATLLALLLTISLTTIATGFSIIRTVNQVRAGNFAQTESVQKISRVLSALTFHQISLIESVKYCSAAAQIQTEISASKNPNYEVIPFNLQSLNQAINLQDENISKCIASASKSKIIKYFLPDEISKIMPDAANAYPDFKIILDELSNRDQTWLILFQNSDELRATGGFTGSYALVSLNQGQISEVIFEDIYDADGQFKGYVTPPPGVKEFLSSNNGLRLPDANWHPDNIKSVQQQLDFFALGQKQNISGVVVINLPFAENLLEISGPVEIPDYDVVVSHLNLNQALREERDEFFAGSIQKKHILSQVVKQTIFKINQLRPSEYFRLVKLLQNGIEYKEIMFYSRSPEIAKIIDKYRASGRIDLDKAEYFIGLVESNVGINKANRNVTTAVDIEIQERRSTINLDFSNNNLPGHVSNQSTGAKNGGAKNNGYVNYQRVLVAPEWQVYSLSVNGQPVEKWDEDLISTSLDRQLKQIGFIVTVPEQSKSSATIELSHPPLVTPNSLQIFKQPGQAPVPYTINYNSQQKHLLLESDQIIVLE